MLTKALGHARLMTYSPGAFRSRIRKSTLLFIAIKHGIQLPSTIDKTAIWAVPSSCNRVRPTRVVRGVSSG